MPLDFYMSHAQIYFIILMSCTRPLHRPVDARDMPAGALIEGKAKRYKDEDGPEASQQYSAATVSMLASADIVMPAAMTY
jgi:hypothetical protein